MPYPSPLFENAESCFFDEFEAWQRGVSRGRGDNCLRSWSHPRFSSSSTASHQADTWLDRHHSRIQTLEDSAPGASSRPSTCEASDRRVARKAATRRQPTPRAWLRLVDVRIARDLVGGKSCEVGDETRGGWPCGGEATSRGGGRAKGLEYLARRCEKRGALDLLDESRAAGRYPSVGSVNGRSPHIFATTHLSSRAIRHVTLAMRIATILAQASHRRRMAERTRWRQAGRSGCRWAGCYGRGVVGNRCKVRLGRCLLEKGRDLRSANQYQLWPSLANVDDLTWAQTPAQPNARSKTSSSWASILPSTDHRHEA